MRVSASARKVARRHLANIELPIRNLQKFNQIYVKKLHDQIQDVKKTLQTTLTQYEKFDHSEQRYIDQDFNISVSDLAHLQEMMLKTEKALDYMKHLLAADYLKGHDKIKHIVANFEWPVKDLEDYWLLNKWSTPSQELIEGHLSGFPEAEPVIRGAIATIAKTKEMKQTLDFMAKRYKETAAFVGRQLADYYAGKATDTTRPTTDKVETLYHVSVNAKTLMQRGFDPRGPSKVEGLGGSQYDSGDKPSISFTSDLFVAKEIYRALQEAIMIASGEIQLRHIMEWAQKEGIWEDVKRSNGGVPPKTTSDLFYYYRYYLALSSSKEKGRPYDPMFFGHPEQLMQLLKTKSPRDVGILFCKVDLTHPSIKYLSSMHEYRVPAEAVLSIDRVITPHGSL